MKRTVAKTGGSRGSAWTQFEVCTDRYGTWGMISTGTRKSSRTRRSGKGELVEKMSKYPLLECCRELKTRGWQHMFPTTIFMDKRIHRRLCKEINRWRRAHTAKLPKRLKVKELKTVYGMRIKIHELGLPLVFVDDESRLS